MSWNTFLFSSFSQDIIVKHSWVKEIKIKKGLQKERNNNKACSLVLVKCKQEDSVLLNGGLMGRTAGREEGGRYGEAE